MTIYLLLFVANCISNSTSYSNVIKYILNSDILKLKNHIIIKETQHTPCTSGILQFRL